MTFVDEPRHGRGLVELVEQLPTAEKIRAIANAEIPAPIIYRETFRRGCHLYGEWVFGEEQGYRKRTITGSDA